MFKSVVALAPLLAAAREWKTSDEIRIEFSGPNNAVPEDGVRFVKYEVTSTKGSSISDWAKTIVVGEGESTSEEVVQCGAQCDSDSLLAALLDEVDTQNAQNFLFIRSGSSKRIILKLRDGTQLGGAVLGALFENPEQFLLHLKYQQIADHPPALRPNVKGDMAIEEPDLEDSIFSLFEAPTEL